MLKSLEEKLKENRCDFCNNPIDEDTFICEHQVICLDCMGKKKGKLHYEQCIYCIMDEGEWNGEWDSWKELSVSLDKLFRYGYDDGDGNIYKKYYNMVPKDTSRNSIQFNKIYSNGYELGMSGQKYLGTSCCDFCYYSGDSRYGL